MKTLARLIATITLAAGLGFGYATIDATPADAACTADSWGNATWTNSRLNGTCWASSVQSRLARRDGNYTRYYYGRWGSTSFVMRSSGSAMGDPNYYRTRNAWSTSGWKRSR